MITVWIVHFENATNLIEVLSGKGVKKLSTSPEIYEIEVREKNKAQEKYFLHLVLTRKIE